MQAFLTREAFKDSLLLILLIIVGLIALIPRASAQTAGMETIMFVGAADTPAPPYQEIFTVKTDGTGLKRLTNDVGGIFGAPFPKWSPDGQHIAFTTDGRDRSGAEYRLELYAMDRDGANRHLVVRFARTPDENNQITGFAWSPDGKTLALTKIGSPSGLFLVPAKGQEKPKLALRGDSFSSPAWSPNGRKIAWMEADFDGLNSGVSAIDVVKANGSRDIDIVKQGYAQRLGPILWSRDGSKIYFDLSTFTPNANSSAIYVAAADGSMDTQLTDPSLNARNPVLSPDGSRIAFTALVNPQIFVMNKDGSGVRQLTNELDRSCGGPSWSPDGKQVTFFCEKEGSFVEGIPSCSSACMYIISPDNPAANLVPLIQARGEFPSFAPRP